MSRASSSETIESPGNQPPGDPEHDQPFSPQEFDQYLDALTKVQAESVTWGTAAPEDANRDTATLRALRRYLSHNPHLDPLTALEKQIATIQAVQGERGQPAVDLLSYIKKYLQGGSEDIGEMRDLTAFWADRQPSEPLTDDELQAYYDYLTVQLNNSQLSREDQIKESSAHRLARNNVQGRLNQPALAEYTPMGRLGRISQEINSLLQRPGLNRDTLTMLEQQAQLIDQLLDPNHIRALLAGQQQAFETAAAGQRTDAQQQQTARTARETIDRQPEPVPRSESGPRREAPSASPERELEHEALAKLVSRIATGRVFMHADLPGRTWYLIGNGNTAIKEASGLGNFGDGVMTTHLTSDPPQFRTSPDATNPIRGLDGEYERNMVEAVAFLPAETPVFEQRPRKIRSGIGGMMTKTVMYDEQVGTEPVMVTNPDTGQDEPGVYFDYAYNPSLVGSQLQQARHNLPDYKESGNNRTGGRLVVRALLPRSIADQVQANISRDPSAVRPVIESLVLERGGIDSKIWHEGTPPANNPVRPPYDQLPPNWQLYIVEPTSVNGWFTSRPLGAIR